MERKADPDGLFQGGQDRSFIMLDMSAESPWTVVFHEYAHQLMNGILARQLDPWFEEGFAEYFASIEVDSKQARVGKVPSYEYQILQQGGMMKSLTCSGSAKIPKPTMRVGTVEMCFTRNRECWFIICMTTNSYPSLLHILIWK